VKKVGRKKLCIEDETKKLIDSEVSADLVKKSLSGILEEENC